MLKSKIHRATVTGTELDYEASITVDRRILEEAEILPNEQVHVLNLSNGSRCITYTIAADYDSGAIILNGPAARLGMVGDEVIILCFCEVDDYEALEMKTKKVFVNKQNRLLKKKN